MSVTIQTDLARYVKDQCGENVYLCYQCSKCSAGCPVADHFDLIPHQVLRAAQLGQKELILSSKTIWLCAACESCATRCPQGIDITRIMDVLKIMARNEGVRPGVPAVAHFYSAALHSIRPFGRMYELGLMAELYLRQFLAGQLDLRQLMQYDLPLAWGMFRAGKLRLLPSLTLPRWSRRGLQPSREASGEAGWDHAIAYYPGCSLHGTSIEYDLSTRAVAKPLGLNLVEPKGWICCGTTPVHSTDHLLSTVMPLRNLALIEGSGEANVTMPCPSCFLRHRVAMRDVRENGELATQVKQQTGYLPSSQLHVDHLLMTITERVGYERVADAVRLPLTGLKVVCYYGCVIARPPKITEVQDYEYPASMDRLMEVLGAVPLDWSYKTECCGVSLVFSQLPIALEMSRKVLQNAQAVGAQAIAVACPLCHSNLDARQRQIREQYGDEFDIPILYFTQLMGLAFGLSPRDLGLDKHFVCPLELLAERKLAQEGGGETRS
jgi:heterodisulfide reductase subunit B